MLNDSGALALVYAEELRDHVASIRSGRSTVKHVICVGAHSGGDLPYEQVLAGGSEDRRQTFR